jgi:Flp pilus assembly protein TadG
MSTKRTSRRVSGQAMLEFAIASIVFISMIFGVIEFGWLLYTKNQVTDAARVGARYAAVNGTESRGLTSPSDEASYTLSASVVKTYITSHLDLPNSSNLTVSVETPDGTMVPGNRVEIDVSYPYHPLIGYILPVGTIDLSATSTMIIHY